MSVHLALLGLAPDTAARIERDLAAAGRDVVIGVGAPESTSAIVAAAELVVVDPKSAARPAVELLRDLRAAAPAAGLVVLTRHADGEDLYQVVRIGGIERYWLLPWSPIHAMELAGIVSERELARERAEREARLGAETAALAEANRRLRTTAEAAREWSFFAAASPAMHACVDAARALAEDTADVCVVGEPGSGRAELARAIHAHGPRAGEPFVRLPAALLRRGTVPGPGDPSAAAGSDLHGVLRVASKWDAARGGTLLVANIDDLDDPAQALLAGLVVGELGSGPGRPRLIATASAEPTALAEEGSLHPRLAERLAAHVLRVPPLRERGEDLARLGGDLLAEWASRSGATPPVLAAEALAELARRPLDGNVPELRELLEQAAVLATSGVIERVPKR